MVDRSRGGGLAPEHVTYSPESQPVEGWEEKHGAGKEQGRVIKALLGGSSSVLMRETEAQGRCRIKEWRERDAGDLVSSQSPVVVPEVVPNLVSPGHPGPRHYGAQLRRVCTPDVVGGGGEPSGHGRLREIGARTFLNGDNGLSLA